MSVFGNRPKPESATEYGQEASWQESRARRLYRLFWLLRFWEEYLFSTHLFRHPAINFGISFHSLNS